MQKLINNDWHKEPGKPFVRAQILKQEIHPEGLDVDRIRFLAAGCLELGPGQGYVISILRGNGRLHLKDSEKQTLSLETGVHLYIPPGLKGALEAEPGVEFLRVSGPPPQAYGKKLLLRNEIFLAACACGLQSFRWIFTPQYLSRRIFLRHDPTLLSKSGYPVSWFHTTMFDVSGLPENEEGEPVFKMSYNSRTEVNFCYDVEGAARVRMALHPYRKVKQAWGSWLPLDSDSTYHLNEAAGGPEEERQIDEATQAPQTFRNKHEVYINQGHVSLFCLFDPAPAGIERHRPGEYSDYEPLSEVLGTKPYEVFAREISGYDEMVDQLSMAKAIGELEALRGTPIWALYLRGRDAQAVIENELLNNLAAEGSARQRVIAPWIKQ